MRRAATQALVEGCTLVGIASTDCAPSAHDSSQQCSQLAPRSHHTCRTQKQKRWIGRSAGFGEGDGRGIVRELQGIVRELQGIAGELQRIARNCTEITENCKGIARNCTGITGNWVEGRKSEGNISVGQ